LGQTATELLCMAIRKVHAGEIWTDSQTAGLRGWKRSPLTQLESEIVGLTAQGFKNKELAEAMFISEQTLRDHLHNILDKLGLADRLELALWEATLGRSPSAYAGAERRKRRRFEIDQEVRYTVLGEHQTALAGFGRTLNISSASVWFSTNNLLAAGTRVGLSIAWPVLFRGVGPIRLTVDGNLLASDGDSAVVAIELYGFERLPAPQPDVI
jgi:DNA-binding CsgD family transcriptional regulator